MKPIVFLCVMCFFVTISHAEIFGPEYWSEGEIDGYEDMVDDRETTCGRFLECGAALYIKYEFDYWHNPQNVRRHRWQIKVGPYAWYAIKMPSEVDQFIQENGYLLLLVEGCICYEGSIFFAWWNGEFYEFLIQADSTAEFCMSNFVFTHTPPPLVLKKKKPITMEVRE